MSKNYVYNDDMVTRMHETANNGVTEGVIEDLMKEFDFPRRSVTAKLRKLHYDVPKKNDAPKFNASETEDLRTFLEDNETVYTAEELAVRFTKEWDRPESISARQINGKALAMEMTNYIKKAEKKIIPKTYTEAEENTILEMSSNGAYLEDVAEALGKAVNSVRGKCLSMGVKLPQKNKKEAKGSPYDQLKTMTHMTVEEIVQSLKEQGFDKTVRGVKTALTRRSLSCKDHTPKTSE